MIVKWNNNIVDYKCKVFFFFFLLQIHPFFFLMLVYVLKKKENMQHMTSVTHTINQSHQPCVDVTPQVHTITPNGSRTRVSGTGSGRSNKERQRLQPLASIGLHTTFTGIHICYIDIPTVGINAPPENLLFCCFLWFSLSSLRFLPPGVGLTGSSRPSKVLLEFRALILKTEHKQTLQSIERLHRTNSDWSRGHIAFRLKTGLALIAVWKRTASCSTF